MNEPNMTEDRWVSGGGMTQQEMQEEMAGMRAVIESIYNQCELKTKPHFSFTAHRHIQKMEQILANGGGKAYLEECHRNWDALLKGKDELFERCNMAVYYTTALPHVKGYYWWRLEEGYPETICEICMSHDNRPYCRDPHKKCAEMGGEWAGPIPPARTEKKQCKTSIQE